jgi:hypothetical protein
MIFALVEGPEPMRFDAPDEWLTGSKWWRVIVASCNLDSGRLAAF